MNYIFQLILFLLLVYISEHINKEIIIIYKNPVFKIIFLFSLYIYGSNDIPFTIFLAFYYVYLGQRIQQKELLYKII